MLFNLEGHDLTMIRSAPHENLTKIEIFKPMNYVSPRLE